MTEINENVADYAQIELFAKEIFRRVLGEQEPAEIRAWMAESVARMGGDTQGDALMEWQESFDFVDKTIKEYEMKATQPKTERKEVSWPWQTWRNLIDPMEPGMLATITAPDGIGKTICAESIAEYWAEKKNKVAFVHYELNRKIMMLRRTARHTSILTRTIKEGKLTPEENQKITEAHTRMLEWEGNISYIHTPGWSMEKTIDELRRLKAENQLDVVVLDYLEKVAPSRRQLQLYGANIYQREADNVEQLKNFAEANGIPVLMVAQMTKKGKGESFEQIDRSDMRGAGEKSDKANLVVIMTRARSGDGYSNIVKVIVDKNTMGGTGTFEQIMQPEYFRMADPALDLDKYRIAR